jgi:hypothetical protein
LVACYRSTDPEFSLAPVHTSVSEELETSAKENPKVNTSVIRVVPRLLQD